MSVKIIAFFEDGWMPPNTDFRQWDHICRAYGVELQMIDDWAEAVVPDGHAVVALDEEGTDALESVPTSNVVFVIGRTGMKLSDISPDYVVVLKTPEPVSLFGISAGSILLSRLYG